MLNKMLPMPGVKPVKAALAEVFFNVFHSDWQWQMIRERRFQYGWCSGSLSGNFWYNLKNEGVRQPVHFSLCLLSWWRFFLKGIVGNQV